MADRSHPTKRFRPVAAGIISVRAAAITGCVLMAGSIGGAMALRWRLGVVVLVYVAMQGAYSLYLKRVAVVDLVAVASGLATRITISRFNSSNRKA